jgi:hypothetical protein
MTTTQSIYKGKFSITIHPENADSITYLDITSVEVKTTTKEIPGTGLIRITGFVITAKSGESE